MGFTMSRGMMNREVLITPDEHIAACQCALSYVDAVGFRYERAQFDQDRPKPSSLMSRTLKALQCRSA